MGIPYIVDSPRRLDVYTPGEPGPWPVVVVVHGLEQGRFSFVILAVAIAAEGAVVLSIGLVGYEGPNKRATHNDKTESVNLVALREEDPELWETMDPCTHIGGNPDLVVRLIHGDDTDVDWYEVPRQVSVDLHQAPAEDGYDAELTLLDGPSPLGLTILSSEAFDVAVQQVLQVAGD